MGGLQDIAVLEARILALESEIEKIRGEVLTSRTHAKPRASENGKTVPMDWLPPSQAILACLREADRPIGVGRLKRQLEADGYPMSKFKGNYFYTLICRLAEAGKITREGDEVMMSG